MAVTLRRTLIVLLGSYLLFSVAAFIISLLEVPALELLPQLYWSWIWANTAEQAMALFPAATVFAVLLSVGVAIDYIDVRRAATRIALIRLFLGVALAAAAIHTVFVLALMPAARVERESTINRTELVRHYRNRAEVHRNEQRFVRARQYVENIAITVPALEEEMNERLSAISEAEQRYREAQILEEPQEDTETRRLPREQTAFESLERAEAAMAQGDWFTAHLFARRAYEVDPRLVAARELAESAWQEIESSVREDERTELFERKREGLRALSEGRHVSAYYLFRELAEEHPDDRDVERYLGEAERALSDQAFFLSDIEDIAGLPGRSNVMYLQESESYRYEIIHFDRLIGAPAVRYGVGVEAVGLDEQGAIAYYLRAPVGGFVGGNLSVRGLHPDDPDTGSEPHYVEGGRPSGLESLIPIETSTVQLLRVALAQGEMALLNGFDLVRIFEDAAVGGFVQESGEQELLRRLLAPFSVVITVLFGFGIGYAGRSRYAEHPPLLSFILLPVLAVVTVFIVDIVEYAQEVGAGLLLIVSPFGVSLGLVLLVQAVLIILALVVAMRSLR